MSMKITCEGVDEGLARMSAALDAIGGKRAGKVIANALNQSLAAGRKEAAREARKAYTAPIRKLFDNINVQRARGGNLQGEIELTGAKGISLFHFKPSVQDDKTRPRGGVTSQVHRKGSRYAHGDPDFAPHTKPFVMRKKRGTGAGGYGIFVRKKGSAFLPKTKKGGRIKDWSHLRMLFGPSPIQALQRQESQEKIRNTVEEAFGPRLQAEIDRALASLKGGSR